MNDNIIPFPKKDPLFANIQGFIDYMAGQMVDKNVTERVWEQEPDQEEWMVSCIALMRVKMHRSKRIDKKWRKLYGFQPKAVQLCCLMFRHPELLHWCGYVGVPSGHLYFKVNYDYIDATAHGGLTFSRMARGQPPYRNGYYFVGFDCAHYEDYVPGMEIIYNKIGITNSSQRISIYRDYNFVKNEVKELADQLTLTIGSAYYTKEMKNE